MADTYRDQFPEDAPPWLLGPLGARFLQAKGEQLDWLADRMSQAVKARFPLVCPSDALPRIGEERGLPRGVAEPEAQYRARLQAAWDAWLWAGTPYGLLRAFQLAGYPSVLLQCQSGKQYTLSGSSGTVAELQVSAMATPVHLGGSPSELWSDISVLIAKPWPAWWGSTAPADGSADQKTAAALVAKWKGAWNRDVKLAVVSGPVWGVSILWGSFTWGSGTSTVWTPPAG